MTVDSESVGLEGRVAIVTAASRGIGAATAVRLAQAGADVVVSARTETDLRQVAEQIEAAGRKAVVVPADLSDLDAIATLAESARATFGRIDVVVNNMGGAMPRPLLDTTPDHLVDAFRFNVATTHALIRAAAPTMLERDGGSIVNVSSVMGSTVGRGYAAYGTAKGALSHYTRLVAQDLAPRIRVNAVAPGAILTPALDIVVNDEGFRRSLEEATPLRRAGDADEVADAIVYLSSPASSYVTGQVLAVSGGIVAPNVDLGLPDL
jgi:7-alpha-hydroxysteroid dehydrogenase